MRATVHARRTLMAGFTSVRCFMSVDIRLDLLAQLCNRDLGTEGAFDADIALRKCLSGPSALIPGPRYFCASKAIIATGSYGMFKPSDEAVYCDDIFRSEELVIS